MELLRFGILELLSESIFFTITFKVSPKRRRYGCGPLYSFQKFYIFAGSNSYNTASTEASIEYLGQRKVCKSAQSCALESFRVQANHGYY
jgi:hypothetical protein